MAEKREQIVRAIIIHHGDSIKYSDAEETADQILSLLAEGVELPLVHQHCKHPPEIYDCSVCQRDADLLVVAALKAQLEKANIRLAAQIEYIADLEVKLAGEVKK